MFACQVCATLTCTSTSRAQASSASYALKENSSPCAAFFISSLFSPNTISGSVMPRRAVQLSASWVDRIGPFGALKDQPRHSNVDGGMPSAAARGAPCGARTGCAHGALIPSAGCCASSWPLAQGAETDKTGRMTPCSAGAATHKTAGAQRKRNPDALIGSRAVSAQWRRMTRAGRVRREVARAAHPSSCSCPAPISNASGHFVFCKKGPKTLASLLGGHRVRDSRHPGEQEGEGSG